MIEIGDKCRIVGMIDDPQFNGEIVEIIGIVSYTEGNKYYIQSDNKELRESYDWVWFSRLEKIPQKMSKKEKYARGLIEEFKPMELNEALTRLVDLSETTNEIKNGISDRVWPIFYRYLKVTKDTFSDPDSDFTVDKDGIHFEGDDGACGSYETKYLTIPLRFFTHTEDAFTALDKRVALERAEAEERMKNARIKLKKDSVARLEQEIRELEG